MAPDTQTALALVSAEVGCLLTLASVAANLSDPHGTFIPVAPGEAGGLFDVHLRAAWPEGERRAPGVMPKLGEQRVVVDAEGAQLAVERGATDSQQARCLRPVAPDLAERRDDLGPLVGPDPGVNGRRFAASHMRSGRW